MTFSIRWLAALLTLALGCGPLAARDLLLRAADGVAVAGDISDPQGPVRGTLLLFHMAGSNRGEYAPLIPRFTALGFRVIDIDQRSGGEQFDRVNETVRRLGHSSNYLEALPDLEAALSHARGLKPTVPVIAVGSSYSAALVFLLAARHPGDVGAIAAFSPGEYLGSGVSVQAAAATLKLPIFVTSSSSRSEVAAAREILAASSAAVKVQLAPHAGVHGASSLREDANPSGAAEVNAALITFLDTVVPR